MWLLIHAGIKLIQVSKGTLGIHTESKMMIKPKKLELHSHFGTLKASKSIWWLVLSSEYFPCCWGLFRSKNFNEFTYMTSAPFKTANNLNHNKNAMWQLLRRCLLNHYQMIPFFKLMKQKLHEKLLVLGFMCQHQDGHGTCNSRNVNSPNGDELDPCDLLIKVTRS